MLMSGMPDDVGAGFCCFTKPHPETGEPSACIHIHNDDGSCSEIGFTLDAFRGIVSHMEDVLIELRVIEADWFVVGYTGLGPHEHVVKASALDNSKRRLPARALCGLRPPRGHEWDLEPLDADISSERIGLLCRQCRMIWKEVTDAAR